MIEKIINEYAAGVSGELIPDTTSVELATKLMNVIDAKSKGHEISVDIDGAISFVIVVSGGRLISGEFTTNGKLYAWLYNKIHSGDTLDQIRGETDITKFDSWFGE